MKTNLEENNEEFVIIEGQQYNFKETFYEMLKKDMEEKKITNYMLYKLTGITKNIFYDQISSSRLPLKKTTVIAIIIGLRFNIEKAKTYLSKAGYAFSNANKFDMILEYYISREKYDFYSINICLAENDIKLLSVPEKKEKKISSR